MIQKTAGADRQQYIEHRSKHGLWPRQANKPAQKIGISENMGKQGHIPPAVYRCALRKRIGISPKDRVIPRQRNPYPPDPKYFDCGAKYGEKQPKPQRPQMFQSFRGRYTQGSIQKKPQQRQGKCLEIPFPLRYANCQRRDCQRKKGSQHQPLHEARGAVQAQVFLYHSDHAPFCTVMLPHSGLK